MSGIGPILFSAFLWGSVLGVFLVFLYEIVAIGRDYGWIT